MKRALSRGDAMPVLFSHCPKYSLRGYPLLCSSGGLHHVVQEARIGGDAVRLRKNTTQDRAKRERVLVGVIVFLALTYITSDELR